VPVRVPVAPAQAPRGGLRVALWLLAGTACGVVLGAMAAFG
jgi:hypothetical protein